MQVISGKYKRKKLDGFKLNNTRPTMSRVKQSMFAMIQNNIKGRVLDLFAGSGALGIEALSMGADSCYFVDNDKNAIKVINKNLENIEEETKVLNLDYLTALNKFKNNIKFDLILLDPPYNKFDLYDIIKKIDEYNILNDNGLIVVESSNDIKDYYECIKIKKMSDKIIKVYKK